MRYLISLMSVILFTFSSTAFSEPAYWRVSNDDVSYLILGSVHVGDESMYPLPTAITSALDNSDGLITEADLRDNKNLRYPSTTAVTGQLLNPAQSSKLKTISQALQLPYSQLVQSPPWATALSIQMQQFNQIGYQANYGVDSVLMEMAIKRNIPIRGLESLQFQINLIANQSDSGLELLSSAIEEYEQAPKATHCLIESWKAGDIQKLDEFEQLAEMSTEMKKSFMTDRNQDWANKLSDHNWYRDTGTVNRTHDDIKTTASSGSHYVVVVGALHLVGQKSLLNLLEQKGFKVVKASESKQARCEFE